MRRYLVALLSLCAVASCGGGTAPTAPTTPVTPTPSTWTLSGTVTSSQTGAGISGASARIADGPNVGKSATADGSGHYSFTGLQQSGFTVNFSATNFNSAGAGVDLTANRTVDVRLTPTPLFTRSGSGANVFDMPTTVSRVRIQATYPGSCENFIVHIAGRSVVNEILGTCSVAIGRTYDGTVVTAGGVVEVLFSSNVSWSFTEVR